jgi:hypothetical protein
MEIDDQFNFFSLQMSYPTRLKEYRELLALKRGEPKSFFEVLAPDVLCHPSTDFNQVRWGVFNNHKSHWAFACCDHTISFVWDMDTETGIPLVTGAKCMTDAEDITNLTKTNWIGVTRLSIDDIEKAGVPSDYCLINTGNFLCKYSGCHHVLWSRRVHFVDAFLYLILDNPQNRNPLKIFDDKTV